MQKPQKGHSQAHISAPVYRVGEPSVGAWLALLAVPMPPGAQAGAVHLPLNCAWQLPV